MIPTTPPCSQDSVILYISYSVELQLFHTVVPNFLLRSAFRSNPAESCHSSGGNKALNTVHMTTRIAVPLLSPPSVISNRNIF